MQSRWNCLFYTMARLSPINPRNITKYEVCPKKMSLANSPNRSWKHYFNNIFSFNNQSAFHKQHENPLGRFWETFLARNIFFSHNCRSSFICCPRETIERRRLSFFSASVHLFPACDGRGVARCSAVRCSLVCSGNNRESPAKHRFSSFLRFGNIYLYSRR